MREPHLVVAVLVLAAGTYAVRSAGVGIGRSRFAAPLLRWSDQAVIVLIAGVTATATLFDGHDFAGWARLAGVAAAAGLAVVRAPLVVVVGAAAVVTALLRAAGAT